MSSYVVKGLNILVVLSHTKRCDVAAVGRLIASSFCRYFSVSVMLPSAVVQELSDTMQLCVSGCPAPEQLTEAGAPSTVMAYEEVSLCPLSFPRPRGRICHVWIDSFFPPGGGEMPRIQRHRLLPRLVRV